MAARVCTTLATCCFVFAFALDSFSQDAIRITAKNDDPRELAAIEQLQRILKAHDLSRWIFTRSVVIERNVRPHSHPVLTLNTKFLDDDQQQLSDFVHEQIHWFLASRSRSTGRATDDLEKLYKNVPVGGPESADTKRSTYLHLVVNYLEWTSMKQIVGEERAREIFAARAEAGYKWIYRTVLADESKISEIVSKHKLTI